jgi:hypothetical protein
MRALRAIWRRRAASRNELAADSLLKWCPTASALPKKAASGKTNS